MWWGQISLPRGAETRRCHLLPTRHGNRWQLLACPSCHQDASDMATLRVHPDRLLPAEPAVRDVARRLYSAVRSLPIVSPHGHVAPAMLLDDEPFADPTSLFVQPDHYVTRL